MTTSRPSRTLGRTRWLASGVAVLLAVIWAVSEWGWGISGAGRLGRVSLMSGCLVVEHELAPPPALPGVQIGAFVAWPPASAYGVRVFRVPSELALWALLGEHEEWVMSTGGRVVSTGPGGKLVGSMGFPVNGAWPSTVRAAAVSYYSLRAVPLWPVVGASMVWAGWAWRGRVRWRDAGRCGGCGYDRSGLAAGARCPECGVGAA